MKVIFMLKDGGYDAMQISPEMLGKLANNICKNGVETVHTTTRSFEVVGILVEGDQIGDRVIITGKGEDERE